MIKNNKGFTLIELLVVVSIIGLLSTMAVVSLNGARKKARDAKRVSEVKQIGTLMEMLAANKNGDYSLSGCSPIGVVNASTTCLNAADSDGDSAAFQGVDMTKLSDPSLVTSPVTPCGISNGNAASTTGCQYAIASTTNKYFELCFFLEDGAGGLGYGLNSLTNGGNMTGGCTH